MTCKNCIYRFSSCSYYAVNPTYEEANTVCQDYQEQETEVLINGYETQN